MLHFTQKGSSDVTGCQCLLSYLLFLFSKIIGLSLEFLTEFPTCKMLLKGADKMAKNDQKCWSQPGFEPGAFQSEKK